MNDFTKDESGGYKHHPSRDAVLKSLGEKKFQTLRNLCENTRLSIDDLFSILEGEELLDSQFVGGVTVYFLKENAPRKRLYNTGNNTFAEKKNGRKIRKSANRRFADGAVTMIEGLTEDEIEQVLKGFVA